MRTGISDCNKRDMGETSHGFPDKKRISEEDKRKLSELGVRILENCRNELCARFPYLDGTFACLGYQPLWENGAGRIGTGGERLFFAPDALAALYMENPAALRRGYLHILLHCLYLHPFYEGKQEKGAPQPPLSRGGALPGGRPPEAGLWNLACDMAVEQVIRRTGAFPSEEDPVKERCLRILGEFSPSAEQICDMVKAGRFPFSEEELKAAFLFDDHSFWEWGGEGERKAAARKKWEKAVSYAGQNKRERKQKAGTRQGSDEEELEEVQKSRYDYGRFLKRFAVLREEVELDLDSFDYIYYHYGIEHYGNLPFVEPLEYKEVHRLEELVIAIDTSGSCSAATVRQFLAETYAILSEKENFFRKMKVYILQCDCYVQDAAVIHSREEWEDYSRRIHIHGRGGTDFRPVFRYVKELQEKKELKHLKALIYFTDGDGIYPRERTDYETAFVFLKKTVKMEMVPPWAKKLIVGRGITADDRRTER